MPCLVYVNCVSCGMTMVYNKTVAKVWHSYSDGNVSEMALMEYVCKTPDCGTMVVVEDNDVMQWAETVKRTGEI